MRIGMQKLLCCTAAFAALMPVIANAGQSCNGTALTESTLRNSMAAAQRVQTALDQRDDVRVALLARVGQDLSQYGLKYSHVGFVYRAEPGQPWRIAHLLNTCGTAKSDLWYEGLGNFFLDDMFSYDALIMVPPKPVADRLQSRMSNPAELRSVHYPAYSLVAYPFSLRYENSNTWVLETTAAAESNDAKIANRDRAQAWLRLAGYRPSEMNIGPFKRLGGRMFKANVAFDDHPSELRFSDRIQTVTVDSIQRFLSERNEGWEYVEVKAQK